ncbi:MAG: hypothetical protein ACLQK8_09770 [Streptosporangiaceae bacterium]
MGRARKRKIKYVQPGYRHRARAAPPSPAERIARLSRQQVLERITKARLHQKELDAELAALMDQAVALGIGWPDIAHRLGVTRQAARQHYQRRHRDDPAERSQNDAA